MKKVRKAFCIKKSEKNFKVGNNYFYTITIGNFHIIQIEPSFKSISYINDTDVVVSKEFFEDHFISERDYKIDLILDESN